jgi:hypothetical protein
VLQKVSASGGVPAPVTVLGPEETGHGRPSFLPDGRHFFYWAYGRNAILIASLDPGDPALLFENPGANNVEYSQGHLLFVRETTLLAQPFDLGRLTLTGEPVPVVEQIQLLGTSRNWNALFSASETGVLVYQTGTAEANSQLTWFDRTGKPLSTVGDVAHYGDVELSPDGTRAAVTLPTTGPMRDIWIVDLARGTRQRLPPIRATRWRPAGRPTPAASCSTRTEAAVKTYTRRPRAVSARLRKPSCRRTVTSERSVGLATTN